MRPSPTLLAGVCAQFGEQPDRFGECLIGGSHGSTARWSPKPELCQMFKRKAEHLLGNLVGSIVVHARLCRETSDRRGAGRRPKSRFVVPNGPGFLD